MKFWDDGLHAYHSAPALIDENDLCVTYAELHTRVEAAAQHLLRYGSRQLGVLLMSNTAASIVAYLACLRARHVPILLPSNLTPELLQPLLTTYQSDWVMGAGQSGDVLPGSGLHVVKNARSSASSDCALAPELGLLLSTSGTTGSPKLVRLSYQALQANSHSIAQYLDLGPSERALTVLPPYYSYGLSIINSHLAAGGCLVLRDTSVLSPDFAALIGKHAVTSIAGVPYTYQMLHRTGFQKHDFPSLRTLTQAGGRLDDRLTKAFGQLAMERGWKFLVMYGQTEATARMSYIPSDRLLDKVGSIGIAIPDGKLWIDPANDEIVYEGPNVMLGYAQQQADLLRPDELQGVLRTGDLGRRDEDGFFYITGRLKRFVKLAGNRVGLDEVEQMLQTELKVPAAVGGRDERMVIWLEGEDEGLVASAKSLIAEQYGLHHSLCRIKRVAQLPLLATGKIDYTALMEDA